MIHKRVRLLGHSCLLQKRWLFRTRSQIGLKKQKLSSNMVFELKTIVSLLSLPWILLSFSRKTMLIQRLQLVPGHYFHLIRRNNSDLS